MMAARGQRWTTAAWLGAAVFGALAGYAALRGRAGRRRAARARPARPMPEWVSELPSPTPAPSERLDKALADSFPASDPPAAYLTGRGANKQPG